MRFHYSLVHANKVLALLRKELRGIKSANGDRVSIEAWTNCREQGYCIKCYPDVLPGMKLTDWAVCFAQARSSDGLVVVSGPLSEFDMKNQPSAALWATDSRRYFDDDLEAAKHIAKEIMKVMEPVAAAIIEEGL